MLIVPTIPDCQRPKKIFEGAKRDPDDQGQKYGGLKGIQPLLSGAVLRELFLHLRPFGVRFVPKLCVAG
jgi:hypothetical protein